MISEGSTHSSILTQELWSKWNKLFPDSVNPFIVSEDSFRLYIAISINVLYEC